MKIEVRNLRKFFGATLAVNNLNFTVGNVPWKIFRVNAIFFAAFGRAGEPLPTAQLAALAAELDHKPK